MQGGLMAAFAASGRDVYQNWQNGGDRVLAYTPDILTKGELSFALNLSRRWVAGQIYQL
jgi:hypothetical protein